MGAPSVGGTWPSSRAPLEEPDLRGTIQMKSKSVILRGRAVLPLLLMVAVIVTTVGCWGSRGFPSNGQMRVRVINESYEDVTDITVTHGDESLFLTILSPGRRQTQLWRRTDQDQMIVISYFHPKVGSERQEFGFRARDQEAGYCEIRFDREGRLDVRTRFRVTEDQ